MYVVLTGSVEKVGVAAGNGAVNVELRTDLRAFPVTRAAAEAIVADFGDQLPLHAQEDEALASVETPCDELRSRAAALRERHLDVYRMTELFELELQLTRCKP